MAELFISKESAEYASNIIIQYLRDAGYEGSMEDGTGIHDIVIKPSSILFALLQQQLDRAEAYLSIDKANELRSSISSSEYDNAIDAILSNWFVTRTEGTAAYGKIRLYFSQLPEYVKFTANKAFASYNTVNFATETDLAYTKEDFISVLNTTTNNTDYYIEVPIKALTKEAVEIPEDTLFNVSISDIYFILGEAVAGFVDGTDPETSDHFVNRTQECINTRELITARAIRTVLTNSFGNLLRLYVVGAGYPEMIRDIVEFQTVQLHVGNKADIWISSKLYKETQKVKVNRKGYAYTVQHGNLWTLDLNNLPAYITKVTLDTGDDAVFTLKVNPTMWLTSNEQPVDLFIPALVREDPVTPTPTDPLTPEQVKELIEKTDVSEDAMDDRIDNLTEYLNNLDDTNDPEVTITYYRCTLTPTIHNFLYNGYNRVASYDPQVKMMTPVLLNIVLSVISNNTSEETKTAIKEAVIDYVDTLKESGNPWVESDMIKHIHNKVAAVVSIQVPTSCTYTFFDMGSNSCKTGAATNKFMLPTGISPQITINTIQFHTELSLITVNFI